jgi:hypothetical protein
MPMDLSSLMYNLSNPTLLFFILGIIAAGLKSDLEIPPTTVKFIAYYLLLAIGFKGGQELAHSAWSGEMAMTLLAALLMSFLVPVLVFYVLKKKMGIWNAGAIAATYGSVSAVTFVSAIAFLDNKGVHFGGHMVAAMALMEAPAIVMGVLLVQWANPLKGSRQSIGQMVKHALSNGSVLIILGSLIIGIFSDSKQAEGIKPFTTDIFKGFLSVFLLDMGMQTAKRFAAFRHAGKTLMLCGILFPMVFGSLAAALSGLWGAGIGDRFLLAILSASASYIAVPASMKMAVPKADPGIYVPMAIGVTFPFNISLGLPLYYFIIEHL